MDKGYIKFLMDNIRKSQENTIRCLEIIEEEKRGREKNTDDEICCNRCGKKGIYNKKKDNYYTINGEGFLKMFPSSLRYAIKSEYAVRHIKDRIFLCDNCCSQFEEVVSSHWDGKDFSENENVVLPLNIKVNVSGKTMNWEEYEEYMKKWRSEKPADSIKKEVNLEKGSYVRILNETYFIAPVKEEEE